MKERLVVALMKLANLVETLVETQLLSLQFLLIKQLVKLNVLKPGIIVIGTLGILLLILLAVLFTQENVLLELQSHLPIHMRRSKCAIGPIHY
jgi:hypothetical protein